MKRVIVETLAQVLTLILIVCMIVLLSGCVGFSGKRKAIVEVNILGNTVKWESTCDGEYDVPEGSGAECPAVPATGEQP